MSRSTIIPTVLRIDVEPDEHQPTAGDRPWDGFLAATEMVDTLRRRLGEVSDRSIRPTWLVRLDPDVKRAFGRADFPVRRHQDLFDQILKHDDALGIHVHPLRWDSERNVLFADHADEKWTTECLQVAASTFRACFGKQPETVSLGGSYLSNAVLDAAVGLGIKADLTVEPGLAARQHDPSFGAYASGPSGDFLRCPRLPYYASRASFDEPATSSEGARPLLMVPLTSCDYRHVLKRWYSRVVKGEPVRHEPLNPWKPWPSPERFWDLASRAADELRAPYLAFAIRTEARHTEMHRRVSALLEYLPEHPIAKRIQIVDPLSPEVRSLATLDSGVSL